MAWGDGASTTSTVAGGLGKTTVATVGSVLLWKSNNTQCRQREVVNFPAICMDLFKRLFPPGRWTQEDLVSAHRANMNMYSWKRNILCHHMLMVKRIMESH